MMNYCALGVNIDHIATLRQARGGTEPDTFEAARICEDAGADGITVHLREDRRHIQDFDVIALRDIVRGSYNLEMALAEDVIERAREIRPDQVTLVPERREELTTEGGLDVRKNMSAIRELVEEFNGYGIRVSLFIEPEISMVEATLETGAGYVEFHTGRFATASSDRNQQEELARIREAVTFGSENGLGIHAGHGLNYTNTSLLAPLKEIRELNIGHAIISRALFTGLAEAVREMKDLIDNART